jgi:transketolase
MALTAGGIPDNPAFAGPHPVHARPATPERRMADAIRMLAMDPHSGAGAGAPLSLPLVMADAASMLWTRFHKFDAADPAWPDRDRFVLSAGHDAMLLYGLLHLTGHDGMDIDEIGRFRQMHAAATGHPEYGAHPAIEISTGPLGQGLAAAVGMALAERLLAARFGKSLVDHRTWVIASDGDLMEGVSYEAVSLAGHLRLEKLTILWDDRSESDEGEARLTSSEDQLKRFAAAGWGVKPVDGHDAAQVAAALSMAMRAKRPTLIACRTTLARGAARHAFDGYGNGRGAVFDGRVGQMGAPPPGVAAAWRHAGARGATARRGWLKRLARHPLRAEYERVIAGRLPDGFHETIAALKSELSESRPVLATAAASQRVLAGLATAVPELVGGSVDASDAAGTRVPVMASVAPGNFAGRYVHYGRREHAMAAAMNGLAVHGGVIPYGGTNSAYSDYMRPALRLAAIMHQRAIHVLAADGICAGANGPMQLPVEQLAELRAMPNTFVFRPADAIETLECWELAIRRTDGPSLLALSTQALPAVRGDANENRCARGGYLLAEADGPCRATLVASGAQVALAMEARERLAAEGIPVAVVSLPCWELFALQDERYRGNVLGMGLRVGVEAASGFGWERWLGADGVFIGMPGFAYPGDDVYCQFGITAEAIATAVRRRLPQ